MQIDLSDPSEAELASQIRPGDIVILFDEEIEVEARLEYDEHHLTWLGQPNWATRRDLSDLGG